MVGVQFAGAKARVREVVGFGLHGLALFFCPDSPDSFIRQITR